MGKKENKLVVKFKKFIRKTISKLEKIVEQGNDNSVVLLVRRKDDGVSYVKGDPLQIHILLEETANRDDMFAQVLQQVAGRIEKKGKGDYIKPIFKGDIKDKTVRNFPGIKSTDGDGVIKSLSIDPEKLDNMSDKEIDAYLDEYTKNARDDYRKGKNLPLDFDGDDSPEE
ncbi:hypothetical protein [Clostridium sp.]|jgi:hypothetical protein|uniref:hypothetical protein n=1 Tax=Clostridium sp. TaxID=1506 RepID=UPI003EECF2D5